MAKGRGFKTRLSIKQQKAYGAARTAYSRWKGPKPELDGPKQYIDWHQRVKRAEKQVLKMQSLRKAGESKAREIAIRQQDTLNYLQGYDSGVVKRNSLDALADMQGQQKLVHKNMKMFDRDLRALEADGWVAVDLKRHANVKITDKQRFQTSFKSARTIYVRPSNPDMLDHNIRFDLTQYYKYKPVPVGTKGKYKLQVDLGFGPVDVKGARFNSKATALKGAIAISKDMRVKFPNAEKYVNLRRTAEQYKNFKSQATKPITIKR